MTISCKEYNIHIDDDKALNAFIAAKEYSKIIVLVDGNTEKECLPVLREMLLPKLTLNVISIMPGEEFKTIDTCSFIWDQMTKLGADRHSLCINLGGGVIGDMGGFCASTYMRGIDFIQLPTSLLSMVDASVGGKLGVDFEGYKNYIGLFNNPNAVFVYTKFLKTLAPVELRSGFAEVIKHALIKDETYWESLEEIEDLSKHKWGEVIHRSIQIKKEITEEDPLEKGLRKILNFGHTIGHAIESSKIASENPLRHGEAVALGMICEAHVSLQKGLLGEADYKRIVACISKHFKELLPIEIAFDQVLEYCRGDKKNQGQLVLVSLISKIGAANYNIEISENEILNSLNEIT